MRHRPRAADWGSSAVWEASTSGRHEGVDAIRRFFAGVRASGRIRNSAHHATNPILEVEGDAATGDGIWRFQTLYCEVEEHAPYPVLAFEAT